MSHCTPDELIDVVEGTRAESSVPHLSRCAACREQLLEVREVLAAVKDVPVPDPSPLFWDHLSARIHDAVAGDLSEGAATAAGGTGRVWWRSWRFAMPMAIAAALALALFVAPYGRPPDEAASRAVLAPVTSNPVAAAGEPADQADPGADDSSIDLMIALADGLDLDAAASAGLAAAAGATDAAVADLSGDERIELARLIREAMGSSGA